MKFTFSDKINFCTEVANRGPLWQDLFLCLLFQLLLEVLAVKDSHVGEQVGGEPCIRCYCDIGKAKCNIAEKGVNDSS